VHTPAEVIRPAVPQLQAPVRENHRPWANNPEQYIQSN
jgi:hypothetical protein